MTTKAMDPQTADRAATAARQAVDEAEQVITSGRRLSLDKLTALVTRARHAGLTAEAVRAQAEQDREQARREALGALAGEIDALAAAGTVGLAAALDDLAAAAERAREAVRAWDEQLAGVAAAADELGCRAPAPGGPREADERVAVTRDGQVYHGETLLQPVGAQLDAALGYAKGGDLQSAHVSVVVKKSAPPLKRADHYVRGQGGLIVPIVGEPTENQRAQLRTGQLTALTEPEIRAYLAGDL